MSEGSGPGTGRPRGKPRARGGNQADRQRGSNSGLAEVTVTPEELIPRLKALLDLFLREMGLAMHYEVSTESAPESETAGQGTPRDGGARGNGNREEPESFVVRFSGEDEEILLARNGELLLALEYLAHRCLRLPPPLHDRVRFECGDFRATRLEELKLSARVAAQRVRETGQPFPFNPMSSRDRRTIHLELTGAPGVRTASEGSGDHRHLVIYPATKK